MPLCDGRQGKQNPTLRDWRFGEVKYERRGPIRMLTGWVDNAIKVAIGKDADGEICHNERLKEPNHFSDS